MKSPFKKYPSTLEDLNILSARLSSVSLTLDNLSESREIIESSYSIFALLSDPAHAEALPLRTSLTAPGYITNNGLLGGGGRLSPFEGLGFRGGWFAIAIWSAGTFIGILVFKSNGRLQNVDGATIGSFNPERLRDWFYPSLSGLQMRGIDQIAIRGSEVTLGSGGWNFSADAQATSVGAYSSSQFSADDGVWAFILNSSLDGDSGPSYRTAGGFGFGNYNSSDASSELYWNGNSIAVDGYLAWAFTLEIS